MNNNSIGPKISTSSLQTTRAESKEDGQRMLGNFVRNFRSAENGPQSHRLSTIELLSHPEINKNPEMRKAARTARRNAYDKIRQNRLDQANNYLQTAQSKSKETKECISNLVQLHASYKEKIAVAKNKLNASNVTNQAQNSKKNPKSVENTKAGKNAKNLYAVRKNDDAIAENKLEQDQNKSNKNIFKKLVSALFKFPQKNSTANV